MFTFYEVGGAVRDSLLGLTSQDIDFTAVPQQLLLDTTKSAPDMFQILVEYLEREGYLTFLITEDCYTVRARFPQGHRHQGLVADFVMARKEMGYEPGTRRPIVIPGSLLDDLERRDFTVNAMARAENGVIIDPFNGQSHLKDKLLVTPLPTSITFDDDPLRILRAIRFSITKGLTINPLMDSVMKYYPYEEKMPVVSEERIRVELQKCFKADSLQTLELLRRYEHLTNYIFKHTKLWLKPTSEQ